MFLIKPSIMTAPRPDETLLIYIAATSRVVSTAIVVEHEEVGHAYKVHRTLHLVGVPVFLAFDDNSCADDAGSGGDVDQ